MTTSKKTSGRSRDLFLNNDSRQLKITLTIFLAPKNDHISVPKFYRRYPCFVNKKEVHYFVCACAQLDGVVLKALGGDKTEKSTHKLTTAEV
jgi:hypothetical protein